MRDANPKKQITCLRCAHCQLLPETNMSRATVIWCDKEKLKKPIILSGCGIADARPYQCGAKKSARIAAQCGDKVKHATEVEKAYLHAHYPTAPKKQILWHTRRSHWLTVVHIANRLGLVREDCPVRRKQSASITKQKKARQGHIFNEEQARYIERCFYSNHWPLKHFGREPFKTRSEATKAEIVARVAELDLNGRVWSWESIRSHMKWVSPSYKRGMGERNKARRDYYRAWAQKTKPAQMEIPT